MDYFIARKLKWFHPESEPYKISTDGHKHFYPCPCAIRLNMMLQQLLCTYYSFFLVSDVYR